MQLMAGEDRYETARLLPRAKREVRAFTEVFCYTEHERFNTMETKHKQGVVLASVAVVITASLLLLLGAESTQPTQPQGTPGSPGGTLKTEAVSTTGRVIADDESSLAFNTDNHQPSNRTTAIPTGATKTPRYYKRTKIALNTTDAAVYINSKLYPLRAYEALLSPNDPSASQWWTGSTNLPSAWDISTGSSSTTIAIIDTGFALDHEEFAGRWHQNSGETGPATQESPSKLNCTDRNQALNQSCNLVDDDLDGWVDNESGATTYQNASKLNCTALSRPLAKDCNNRDDDGNGFADDVTGWDFMNQDSSVQAGQLNPAGEGTTHGTMVTGVAAATGNNSRGIAGVNWGTKILPIQALDDDGYGDTVSVGQSIYYAIDQGVDVISISLGTPYHDTFVQEAIEAATKAGIVVVAASGNDGCNCMSYPARYPEVVAVGALSSSGAPASFSSWGDELDILAPGSGIRTTTWAGNNGVSAYASNVAGTSFATPYIAGLIAAMKPLQIGSSPLQLISALGETTYKPAGMAARPWASTYGFGVVSAASSLRRLVTPKTDLQVYQFTPVASGAYLRGNNSYETSGKYYVHYCDTTVGATPVYELQKGTSVFYTISKIEVRKALLQGYSVRRFAYSCMRQNHDTYTLVRLIDIFKEFRNDYSIR